MSKEIRIKKIALDRSGVNNGSDLMMLPVTVFLTA